MSDSKKIDDGGPAYPQHDLSAYGMGPSERGEHGATGDPEDFGTRRYTVEGMSIRDWFAGQMLPRMGVGWPNDENKMILASRCYEIADAMIAARKAGG